MTLSNKLDNSATLKVEDEVDVDDLFVDVEGRPQLQLKRSIKLASTTTETTCTMDGAGRSHVASMLDSMSSSDVQKLRVLLGLRNDSTQNMTDMKKKEECGLTDMKKEEECGLDPSGEKEEWHKPFGQSTYTLLVLYGVDSLAFWYGAFVYAMQVITILLTLIDIVDWTGNGLKLPPNVDMIVTIAQGVALFQALAFQSDLIEAVLKLKEGYHPEVLETYPGATYSTWLASCIAQFIAGLLLLITIYILTMQVDNVLGIMLNFAALHFIADIDDLGFYMSKSGFMGGTLQRAANDVSNFQVRKKHTVQQGFLDRAWKPGSFFFILSILLSGWITIVIYRVNGKFVCNTVMVNMGDSFVPALGAFNGLYDFEFAGSGLERRAEYVERRSEEIDSPGRGVFGYCNDIQAWTFRIDSKDESDKGHPCKWIARSSVTSTYDITESVSGPWFVRDDTFREVLLEPMGLFCFDCSSEDDESSADCGGKGVCSNAVCHCDQDWYGLRCEFKRPCPWLTIDARTEKFASTRDWVSDYQSIELSSGGLVEAYHRPVYIYEYSSGEYDVVMFTGGRWALTSSEFLPNRGRIASSQLSDGQDDVGNDIGNFFKHAYHGYRGYSANSSVAFLSDFMAIGSDVDSSSPVGFIWYRAEETKSEKGNQGIGQEISTEFLCHVCDEANPCFYDGVCNTTNQVCECSRNSGGSLCEVPPVQNGRCDPFFNTPEFRMDGGDCCESTCESTSQYICGTDEDGYASTGFYYCKQPEDQWQIDYLEKDPEVTGSFYGFAVAVTDTSIVINFLPGEDASNAPNAGYDIYDKVAGSWVLRYSFLAPYANRLTLSSGPYKVALNQDFLPPLTMVTHVASARAPLLIYKCTSDACNMTQEIPDVRSYHMSADGNVLLVHYGQSGMNSLTRLFDLEGSQFQFQAGVNITENNSSATVSKWTQSADGSLLALLKHFPAPGGEDQIAIESVEVMSWNQESMAYDEEAKISFESGLDPIEDRGYRRLILLRISQDGTVLAFGTRYCGNVQLHIFARDSEGNWHPREPPPINSTDCTQDRTRSGSGLLHLSRDGSEVAFLAYLELQGFKWHSEVEVWHPVKPIHLRNNWEMSSDGSNVAIADAFDGQGRVSVYSLPRKTECHAGMSLVRLSLNLGTKASEYVWKIQDKATGQIFLQGGPYQDEGYWQATFVEETCVPTDSCYVFILANPNNGAIFLTAPSHFAIYMDGKQVHFRVPRNARVQTAYFGNCDSCPSGTLPVNLASVSCGPMEWELVEFAGDHSAKTIQQISSTGWASDAMSSPTETCNIGTISCGNPVVLLHDQCLLRTSCYLLQGKGPPSHNATGFLQFLMDDAVFTSFEDQINYADLNPDPSCPTGILYFAHGNYSLCPKPNNPAFLW